GIAALAGIRLGAQVCVLIATGLGDGDSVEDRLGVEAGPAIRSWQHTRVRGAMAVRKIENRAGGTSKVHLRAGRGAWTAVLAVTTMLAGAGVARAEFIEDALGDAYRTNPQLAAQRAVLRAVDETVPQALANWRPTVTVTGQAGVAHDDTKQEKVL